MTLAEGSLEDGRGLWGRLTRSEVATHVNAVDVVEPKGRYVY